MTIAERDGKVNERKKRDTISVEREGSRGKGAKGRVLFGSPRT